MLHWKLYQARPQADRHSWLSPRTGCMTQPSEKTCSYSLTDRRHSPNL